METAAVGVCKMTGVGLFIVGCVVAAPRIYQNPDSPAWMTPAAIIVSAIPMVTFHFMMRPFIANIFIDAPTVARRSKETLVAFARRLPPDTRLEIETLGFIPVPRTRGVRVSEMRTLTPSFFRLANLEHVPAASAGKKIPKWMRFSLGYFYARPSSSRWKNSRAPEVWPLVLDFINRNTIRPGSMTPAQSTKATRQSPMQAALDARKVKTSPPTARRKSQQMPRNK